ncbi:MAG: chemotaxis protein CheB [Candidatus Bruticola sp.]
MVRLLIIDPEFERSTWLSQKLSSVGFYIAASVLACELTIKSISKYKPNLVIIAPLASKLEGAQLALSIMEQAPVPIILLYSEETADRYTDISWCGAVASMAIPPPPSSEGHSEQMQNLVNSIRLMHVVPVVKRRSGDCKIFKESYCQQEVNLKSGIPNSVADSISKFSILKNFQYNLNSVLGIQTSSIFKRFLQPQIIGIAASTGGLQAVKIILNGLPPEYPIPILLVQHISEGFNVTLISTLSSSLNLHVQEAVENDELKAGIVYVAPSRYHLTVNRQKKIKLLPKQALEGHCPSATAMFSSLAENYAQKAVGIILSGMGDDGSEGLVHMREVGSLTIAQDQASCLISSMPKQAVLRGAIEITLPPPQINILLRNLAAL